ncbi:hypothetical protein A1Q1_01247 [Trichosporon asahii var. asahii CBS 2479]|uniref:Uncharacterized protein n=1 Tax=Trichosporon asahii var. asahii (strain ATCC 90039 / CBS 2479 / JCM 2466 / KCTC 7840 / NBRC 103889/ NCYC 2677 / UAMH 7654) TaxID=1186058 RepID=J5QXI4_TRIAS|nr:hypothetical protein A1Q1_01247 [Trichosporon asahii var. asahii CBS 2479]EJT49618.1 hypothetical protein A1Q1_01247 [Trichosporon asahii var. asahii CBS 2479]
MQRLAQDWPLGAHSGRKIGVIDPMPSLAFDNAQSVIELSPADDNISRTAESMQKLPVHSQAAPERLVCAVLPELTGAEKAKPSGSNGAPHWLRTHRLVPVAQVLIGTPS